MLDRLDQKQVIASTIGVLLLTIGVYWLCFEVKQSDFVQILVGYIVAFLGYALLNSKWSHRHTKGLVFCILIAIIPILSMPNLSDDVYRFIWDGTLIQHGISPYSSLPSEILPQGVPNLDKGLFDELNSQEYYTIYPPISQTLFYLSSSLGTSIYSKSVILKALYLLIHIAGLVSLFRFAKRYINIPTSPLIYALNPLMLVEGLGNLHSEVIAIPFLIMAITYFGRRPLYSAAAVSASIAIKILPLILLPFLAFRKPTSKSWTYLISVGVITTILFIPIFWGLDIAKFSQSVDLYFRKFEFNASVYYLLRTIGRWISGHNLIAYIGPLLGITTITLIFQRAYRNRDLPTSAFFQFGVFAFMVYLILSTTIHPWYILFPLLLSTFTKLRSPIVWSLLSILSYSTYITADYNENLWVIALEYLLLLPFLLYDLRIMSQSVTDQLEKT